MASLQEIRDDLDSMVTMKFIAQAFSESSAAKLKKIRDMFEKNKEFYNEITHIYHLVRVSAAKLNLKDKSANSDAKSVIVALTSNQRFYGNINTEIMNTFKHIAEKSTSDLLILGSTGKDILPSAMKDKVKSLVFEKDTPNAQETNTFLDTIKIYDKVLVYYPKYVTMLTQTVGELDITQLSGTQEKDDENEIHILFEPELPKILEFFERQVRAILFMRVLLEADLSRTSARLMTMSAAEQRSDELIIEKKNELRKIRNSTINAQLLEMFAGMSKWKK